ncbi:unnamed protein product [Malus baccata var. baccata]
MDYRSAAKIKKGIQVCCSALSYLVLTRVKLVSEAFQFCRWSWVSRTANGAADFLASRGFPEMGSRVWVDRPPSSLVFVLNKDGLPCPP